MPEYRFVRLFITVGPVCAAVCALSLIGIAVSLIVQGIVGWIGALLLVAAGVFAAFLIMVLVDLTRLITDMLLPR